MGFEYTVLPDGSILKLNGPEDFECARCIARDELGNDAEQDSNEQ